MTRWIELADERHFFESAMLERVPGLGERRHLSLGAALLGLPSRIRHSLGHRTEAAPGR
jgi:hypothetical protein